MLLRLVSVVGNTRRPMTCMRELIVNVPCQRNTVDTK